MEQHSFTPEKDWPRWAKGFLSSLAITGNVSAACKACDLSRPAAYELKKRDHDFAAAWASAMAVSADTLEEEARRRAYDGVSKPVLYKGKPVFVWRDADGCIVPDRTKGATKSCLMDHEYSDTLLIFLLNGAKPNKYRRRMEHTGPEGQPLQQNVFLYLPENGRDTDTATAQAGDVPQVSG